MSKYQGKAAVVATVLDMSERRRIESSLRESEERYRNLFESVSDMVQSVDANGRLLFANPAWLNTLGYTSEEAMGLEIFSIIHPDDREHCGQLFPKIFAGEEIGPVQMSFVAKDGRRVYVEGSVSGRIVDGKVVTTHGFFRDTTDAETAEKRFANLLESAPDAMVIVSGNGEISLVNRQTEKLFGYRRDEIVGNKVEMLIPKRYRDGHPKLRSGFHKTPHVRQMGEGQELFGLRKDGTEFPVEISLSPIETGAGKQTCSAIRDVSEKKRSQQQLVQSERLSAIGQAMTGLVHESRNALARSQAGLKLLSRKINDRPELFRYIDEALAAQKDLQQLFEQVRDYAAPKKLSYSDCHVPSVVEEVWAKLAEQHPDREVEIVQDDDVGSGGCELDVFSFSGVVRNLIENSLAACSDPVRISIEYRDTVINGQTAMELKYRDNGSGVKPEDVSHIFDAFFTTKTQGTGLGMAIAKRSVESHGGIIELRPREGIGAEFVITLPRKQP